MRDAKISNPVGRRQPHRSFSDPLDDCEVKSITLRIPKRREAESPFWANLSSADLKRVSDTYYQQIAAQKVILFSVVIDKRKLHAPMTAEMLHKKG